MRRRRVAPGPATDPEPQPASRRRVLDHRDALYRTRRRSEENQDVWVASLNPDALPKLRINRMYADILQNNRSQSGSSSRINCRRHAG